MEPKTVRFDLLKVLANHLETQVDPEEFDMREWKQIRRCGTVACAIGHACSLPEFQEAGIKLETHREDERIRVPVYKNYRNVEAVGMCLGISVSEATLLFTPHGYDGSPILPQVVAKKIRNFIKSKS